MKEDADSYRVVWSCLPTASQFLCIDRLLRLRFRRRDSKEQNARRTRHSRYQSQTWRLRKRNSPQSTSRSRTKPNSSGPNSSPSSTPAQQLWALHTPRDSEEQVHRVWTRSRCHFRVWSFKGASLCLLYACHPLTYHSVPIPHQGSARRAAGRSQGFLVDKTRCVHCPFPLLLDTLVGATNID